MAVKLVKPINYKNIEKITDADFEKQLKLLGVNSKFIVALSGGPDSLALLYLAKNFAKKNNLKFTAVSIDHNLREDSSKEIEWIKKLMKKEKVCFVTKKVKKKISSSNTLSKARKHRYELLTDVCKKNKFKYLLTAHHLDDEIETFLMRLIRGSGIKGLSSLKPVSKHKGGEINIIRPLLKYSKKCLIKYLATIKQSYLYDNTNHNMKYDRSRIRGIAENLINEGLDKKRILEVIQNLKKADEAIIVSVNNYLKKSVSLGGSSTVKVKTKIFKKAPVEIQYRIINKLCRLVGNKDKVPRSKSLQSLIDKINTGDFRSHTLNGCIFVSKSDEILISKEKRRSRFLGQNFRVILENKDWPKLIEHY